MRNALARYSTAFKAKMLERLLGPDQRTATSLSRETGIAQVTLSRWKREARTLGFMSNDKSNQSKKKRRPRRTAADRLRILAEASSLSGDELGALLRREGLHSDDLEHWRALALQGLTSDRKGGGKSPEQKELQAVRKRSNSGVLTPAVLFARASRGRGRSAWGSRRSSASTGVG